jgi:hypothetical protein
VNRAIHRMKAGQVEVQLPPVTDAALEGLKFSDCLPLGLAQSVLQQWAVDDYAVPCLRRSGTTVVQ